MAQVPHGTTLTFGSSVVAELRDMTPTVNGEAVDVTTHDSGGWNEYLGGLKDAKVKVTGMYQPSDTGQAAMFAALGGAVTAFSIVYPNGYGFSGSGIVTSFEPTGPYDGASELSMEIQVSGALTDIVPS